MQKTIFAFVGALCILGGVALAGENIYLGRLASSGAGVSVNNFTTAVPFGIPPGAKVTMYCDAAARVLTDKRTVTVSFDGGAYLGVPVAVTTLFPTSVGRSSSQILNVLQGDAGYTYGPSAVISAAGATAASNCDVWQRVGDE